MSDAADLKNILKLLDVQKIQKNVEGVQSEIMSKFNDVAKIVEAIKNIPLPTNTQCASQKQIDNSVQATHPLMYNDLPETDKSNIVFMPAQRAEDTKVFVGDIELTCVVRAKIDYNPDLGFPVLHLEIVNPTILHDCI
jgi:hypothetical protein